MLIERQLENDFIAELKSMPELSASQVVGSREVAAAGETKSEEDTKATIVAVACGFRQNDAFSLSPISMPMSITIMTRSELDPTSEYHDAVVESIADLLSRWHKYGDEMADALTTEKFLAGELRMDGGTNRVYDSMNSTWSETLTFTIRGAEKFIPPPRMTTIVKYDDGMTVELDIQGVLSSESIPNREYISEVDIGNAVTSIEDSTFRNCSNLTSVTIPNSVTSIGNFTFEGCTGLTSATIGNSVTSIGANVFSGCTSLASITIPGNVNLIGPAAFVNCTGLTSVVVENGVKDIANYAFQNCTSLANVTIPASVTSIGADAFKNCTNVTDAVVPGWNCHIPFSAVTNLVVSEGTTSIWPSGFFDSSNLASATIPTSVTSIGTRAFRNCSKLMSLTIPSSVTSIGQYAFNGSGLTSVTFSGKDKATVQGMENYSWSLRSSCVLHCTDGDITI